MAWIYSGGFTVVLSAPRMAMKAGVFFPLQSWHLMNCLVYMFDEIPPLCFAVFPLSVLGKLEGGEGPGSFPWFAPGRAELASSCARQCTENSVWSP